LNVLKEGGCRIFPDFAEGAWLLHPKCAEGRRWRICPERDESGSGRVCPEWAKGGSEECIMNVGICSECMNALKEGR
jgi:hypothetical protein